jgi:ubiquinone/menaquinone biosynthesis C-methylase UbiE
MVKVRSPADILDRVCDFRGKTIADVGCGTGDFVRRLTERGAKAVGVDAEAMIARAERIQRAGGETYLVGSAEEMEFEDGSFDLLTYIASFHHVPAREMPGALERCHRFLKPGGMAAFIEPLGRQGSYFEIVRLLEQVFYAERSLDDYAVLLDLFVEDPDRRARILEEARSVTERLARDSGKSLASYRYRSICRLNILKKAEISPLRIPGR